MTEQEIFERFKRAIEQAGGVYPYSRQYAFTPAYIYDILHKRRGLSDRILATIGVRRVMVYEEVETALAIIADPYRLKDEQDENDDDDPHWVEYGDE